MCAFWPIFGLSGLIWNYVDRSPQSIEIREILALFSKHLGFFLFISLNSWGLIVIFGDFVFLNPKGDAS